jgi:hypothetical protein
MPDEVQQCIKDCTACGSVCQETINYCLQVGGRHVEQSHLRLMMDCAEICQASQNYMLRRSDYSAPLCRVCADVCRDCADSCSRFAGDTMMQDCAEVCRRCAASCQRMVEALREKAPSAV